MKKLIVFAVAICFSTVMSAQKIVIKGSDTVLPLSQKEAETYMKKNAGKSVTVVGGGSGVGISALFLSPAEKREVSSFRAFEPARRPRSLQGSV